MSQPLHVTMIIQGYHPRVGGAERQLAALAPLLGELGVAVSVLTRRYPGLAPFERVDAIPVYRLPIPGPTALGSLVFTLAALPLIRRLAPDVLHAHELLSPTTTALAARALFRIPVVAKVLRGGLDGDLAKLRRNRLSARRLGAIRDQVDAFAVISQEIDGELAALGVPPQRRQRIPNGVDLGRFAPPSGEARQLLRSRLGLHGDPLVVYTGRLAPEKRLGNLLAVWPAVRARHPEALLALVGGGPEAAALEAQAGEGVYFAGAAADVSPYLQAADLFVLPSATEGLSNSLLEAMATGLPVVASAVGGAEDCVRHGESGLLMPPDDLGALQEALFRLLGDPELRARYGQEGRTRVVESYDLQGTACRLRLLYDALRARGVVNVAL